MTIENEIDYKALKIIGEQKISANELRNQFYSIVSNSQSPILFKKFVDNGYIGFDGAGDSQKVFLSEIGNNHLDYLLKEKNKEDADYKLKLISLNSIRFNMYFPLFALIVAVFAFAVPTCYRIKDGNSELPKQKKLQQQVQEIHNILIPKTDKVHLHIDSLTNVPTK